MDGTLRHLFQQLETRVSEQIIGQKVLINRLMIALLADGHLLVEGAPGLAKTRAINALSQGVDGDFQRIQFTPDLLPSDLTGTDIYRPQDGSFHFQQGPLFHHMVLADEINRAPAKVQAALLEAMAERQITVGGKSYPLASLFLVMATQNPIEQEGTYPLPEAQLDRFLLHVRVDYPHAEEELQILRLTRQEAMEQNSTQTAKKSSIAPLPIAAILAARKEVLDIPMTEQLEDYIVRLVVATRQHGNNDVARSLQYGASPRASIALDRCARAHAWLANRDYVSPEDIHAIAFDVLRHRLILNYEAEAEGINVDAVIQKIIQYVALP
ncbi:MAG: MoxR family ATPase [Mariprofundaceae bacterium]|nr:MoxR family ATPase [Mariprofundaceae bacterium]